MAQGKYEIYRHINNITLNPFEYVLDDEDNQMFFDSAEDALAFMNKHISPPVSDVEELEDNYGFFIAMVEDENSCDLVHDDSQKGGASYD